MPTQAMCARLSPKNRLMIFTKNYLVIKSAPIARRYLVEIILFLTECDILIDHRCPYHVACGPGQLVVSNFSKQLTEWLQPN